MMKNKEAEGDKLMKRAEHLCKPSLIELRLKPDWNQAAPLYEQAMTAYRSSGCWEKATVACEKAADAQEKLGSSWHAGKLFEQGGEIAKKRNDYASVALLYTQASHAFFEAGQAQAGSKALYKAASEVEDALPEKSSELYLSAIEALEQDERFSFGPDLFRSAVSHEIKQEHYPKAAALLLQFAAICSERGLNMSVCRSYLGAVVIWLYIENLTEAEAVFDGAIEVDTFRMSEERSAAAALLEAYRYGDANRIKATVSDHVPFQFLDTVVGRLAMKLPIGDVSKMVAEVVKPEEEDLT